MCSCPLIEEVSEIKYLGLTLDTSLSWKAHISNLRDKLVKYVRLFYVMKTICYSDLLKIIYYALISSKLEYGLCIWGGTYITSLKPLIILQKCFIRLVLNRHRLEHTQHLFKLTKILPLRSLYIFKVLREFYVRSGNNIQINIDRSRTRRILDVSVPKPNLTLYKKFYVYLAPKLYNSLYRSEI